MKRFCFSILAGLLTACSTPLPPPPPASTQVPRAAAPEAAPSAVLKAARIETGESPMAAFERTAGDSVYFDFEGSAIKSDQTAAVSEHAKLAIAFSNDHVTLQGNCDERGSREYNLALGQRRAEAAKQSMVLLGVPQERIDTISFGKEKPRALCHEETCWAKNRRADFVDEWK